MFIMKKQSNFKKTKIIQMSRAKKKENGIFIYSSYLVFKKGELSRITEHILNHPSKFIFYASKRRV